MALTSTPSGGTRVAWMGTDGQVHVTALKSDDTVDTAVATVSLPAFDFGDIYADDNGGVLLLTRDAKGGGTLNCGTLTNLCGATASLPSTDACYDMYMVRFDGSSETWATQLTESSAAHPPYLNSPTDSQNVTFIWWYAHHGRIAFDGTNYAGYYGAAISVSQSCVNSNSAQATGVNIHQGDQMRILNPSGVIQSGGFDWGCSHSGYERIVWDPSAKKFMTVCKNDLPTSTASGRIAIAPNFNANVIYSIDLSYSNLGNVTLAEGGGYWLTTSNIRPGQTVGADGLADVHLLHFTNGASDQDILLASDDALNDRAPHLASYGASHLLAAWETSTATGDLTTRSDARTLYVQVLDSTSGAAVSPPMQVAVAGNRYQEFKPYPDGSVAYAAPGSSNTKIKILRIMPCQ